MTNLKREDLIEALYQVVNVIFLIDDGYHDNELVNLDKVRDALFNELNNAG